MGPLCKLWESLETVNKEQDLSISINDLIKFVTQIIILVGQTNIALSYYRRFSALDGFMKSTIQIKSMLKNKSELLQKENKDLFGKEFREQILETVKGHKQSKELLASAVFKNAASGNQPYRKGSPPGKHHLEGQRSYKHNSRQKSWNFKWSNKHDGKYANENNLFQADTNSGSTRIVPVCPNAGKKIIRVSSTSKCSDSRKIKALCKKVQFLTKDQIILEIVKGYRIPSLSRPLQQQLPREIHLNLKEKSVVVEEIENLLKKVAIEKVHMKKVFAKSQFVSNLFPVKKRDGGNRPVINLKNLNQYIPHHHFKMEGLQSLRVSSSRATSCENWI